MAFTFEFEFWILGALNDRTYADNVGLFLFERVLRGLCLFDFEREENLGKFWDLFGLWFLGRKIWFERLELTTTFGRDDQSRKI